MIEGVKANLALNQNWMVEFSPFCVFPGRGGASIYGKQFEDELNQELKFTGKEKHQYVFKLSFTTNETLTSP